MLGFKERSERPNTMAKFRAAPSVFNLLHELAVIDVILLHKLTEMDSRGALNFLKSLVLYWFMKPCMNMWHHADMAYLAFLADEEGQEPLQSRRIGCFIGLQHNMN